MNNLLRGVNLYLIGMMGAGKTTVGQLLAEQLGYRFVDTDTLIERIAGQPINQIFSESGEATFRQLESQVLSELSAYTKRVIATGGGIILKRENWSYLQHGIVVWLDVPIEQLQARLQSDTTRPLLSSSLNGADLRTQLATLLNERRSLYAQADTQVIGMANETPAQVAGRVLEQLQQVIKPLPAPSDNGAR